MAKLIAEHLNAAGAPDIRKDWKAKDVTEPVTAKWILSSCFSRCDKGAHCHNCVVSADDNHSQDEEG